MCGIVGILGDHEVGPLLVNALKRLEYRGYDSALSYPLYSSLFKALTNNGPTS